MSEVLSVYCDSDFVLSEDESCCDEGEGDSCLPWANSQWFLRDISRSEWSCHL